MLGLVCLWGLRFASSKMATGGISNLIQWTMGRSLEIRDALHFKPQE
jgi:hypothetical protein